MPDARLPPDASAEEQNAAIAAVIERALEAGESSVQRGPELLPTLREAGVVDAGGYAADGVRRRASSARSRGGTAAARAPRRRAGHPSPALLVDLSLLRELRGHRHRPRAAAVRRRRSSELGDSLLIVGDQTTLKVHIHTDDPDAATAVFAAHGAVSHLDVADMRAQLSGRDERASDRRAASVCGAVAVASGAGMSRCSRASACARSTGARRSLPRATTYWPRSTRSRPSRSWCCPTARARSRRRVAPPQLSDKAVSVVPSLSPQAGLAAAVALDPTRNSGQQRGVDDQGARARPHGRGRARRRSTTLRAGSAPVTRSGSSRRRSSPGAGPGRRSARCSSSSRTTPS